MEEQMEKLAKEENPLSFFNIIGNQLKQDYYGKR